jgi:hypothetical protein
MIDFQVFRDKHPGLNQDYIRRELNKIGLYRFYQNVSETLAVWFGDERSNDMTDYITGRILASGQYGQTKDRLLASAVKGINAGVSTRSYRRRKFLNAVFSTSNLLTENPILTRIPILFPLFWIKHAFIMLVFHRDRIIRKWNDLHATSDEKIEQYKNELTYVGLDFDFNEEKSS